MKVTFAFFFLLLFLSISSASEFQGKVIVVRDGDTIDVLHDRKIVRVRLYGVDCPEDGQSYAMRAEQFTSDLALGATVRVHTYDLDDYNRTVAEVFLADGRSLNHELVKAGFAWWFRIYAPNNKLLSKLEAQAKASKIGLWSDNKPVPPWVYRRTTSSATSSLAKAPEKDADQEKSIAITFVHCNGTGANEPDEYVEIRNTSIDDEIDLANWMLHDEGLSHRLVFSKVDLDANESCRIYTNQSGGCANFKESRSAVWNNKGDCAYLLDESGTLISKRCCDD